MASVQLSGAGVGAAAFARKGPASFDALRLPPPSAVGVRTARRPFRGLVIRAATVVAPKLGAQVVYSKYAGTEVELNGSNHIILKEGDIIGILETDDVKDMKSLNDRVLIKVAEAEDKTPGGLLLTETTKEKPSIGQSCTWLLAQALWMRKARGTHCRCLQAVPFYIPSMLAVSLRVLMARVTLC